MEFLSHRIETMNGEPYLRKGGVKVRDILALLDQGLKKAEILEQFPALVEQDVHACKALAVMVLEDRPEFRLNRARQKPSRGDKQSLGIPVKFMFDENLSWKIIPELVGRTSRKASVSQIHLEDMSGQTDNFIWENFRTNGSRSIIVTEDNDFRQLSEVFAMHAMMGARSYHAPSVQAAIKDQPFVVHIDKKKKAKRRDETGKKRSVTYSLSKEEVIEAFSKRAQNFIKEAMREPQGMVWMGLNRHGIFQGPSLPEIFLRYAKTDFVRGLREGVFPDLQDVDFYECVDWKKLNKVRKHVGLQSVSVADYPQPAMMAAE